MGKVKKKLYDEAAGKKASAEARRQRDLKKFGKQVQVAKLQQRNKEKRDTLEKINSLKRSTFHPLFFFVLLLHLSLGLYRYKTNPPQNASPAKQPQPPTKTSSTSLSTITLNPAARRPAKVPDPSAAEEAMVNAKRKIKSSGSEARSGSRRVGMRYQVVICEDL